MTVAPVVAHLPARPDAAPDPLTLPSLLDGPVVVPAGHLGVLQVTAHLADHLESFGARPRPAAETMLELLDALALSGRGGGHFPAARKWRATRDAVRRSGQAAVVVANAAEGEPASAKDAALLAHRPHLVLDGLALAAETVGAGEVVVWTHGDSHELHRVLVQALAERRAAGLVEPSVRLVTGPARYLSGESSVIVRALSGGPALPEFRRLPAAVDGVRGRPTLVNNVETLARAALAARTGAEGHRPSSLVTVLAEGRRTVLEAAPTWRLRDAALAGGWPIGHEPQAVLLGGYGGSWLPWSQAADLQVEEAAMRAAGVSLGAGVVALLPPGACGLAETARVSAYLAASSARQCGPCVFGLPAISGVVAELVDGRAGRADLKRLRRWAEEVSGRGGCHHPDGTVRMTLSALRTFAADVEAHRRGRPCAGVGHPPVLPVPVQS